MPFWSQIANPAIWKRNTLNFVQVIQFGPNLIKSNKLDHNFLALLQTVEIGVGIILNFRFFSNIFEFSLNLFPFLLLRLCFMLANFFLKEFEFLIDVPGMMHFL